MCEFSRHLSYVFATETSYLRDALQLGILSILSYLGGHGFAIIMSVNYLRKLFRKLIALMKAKNGHAQRAKCVFTLWHENAMFINIYAQNKCVNNL